MKFLIVGLGNPGSEYEETRHNIGFKVVDALAKELGGTFSLDKAAYKTEVKFKGRTLVLIKPITYMNLSGKAVNYWLQAEKINLESLVVITDDLALPFGKLRMKGKGSDGGHNGLKDIQAILKTQDYVRLRFGVGSDFAKGKQSDYVLGNWSKEESLDLPGRIGVATEFVKSFSTQGLALTMTNWNNK
ncbi:MAG TPA: aminoacyl-tRNA hydrolase [Crocinitomicaceae bacterium]|nr:aminoacyl-tRNA hydrolase [Flavobacteriales bacterium]HBW85806.1 aminoacyl-tRNA hydrolase [Crocinitomicaceae bacterium]